MAITISLSSTDDIEIDPKSGVSTWASSHHYNLGDNVIGTDGNAYTCTSTHTSSSGTRPISGASYSSYWSASKIYLRGDTIDFYKSASHHLKFLGISTTLAAQTASGWVSVKCNGTNKKIAPPKARPTSVGELTNGGATIPQPKTANNIAAA